jgi:hypothetical protein
VNPADDYGEPDFFNHEAADSPGPEALEHGSDGCVCGDPDVGDPMPGQVHKSVLLSTGT